MPSLNDRVVLLTGGATGIGRAIALDMAAAGATVAIGDTNVDDGQRTVEKILSAGGKASFRSCDVAEAGQVTALVNGAVADFGRLDVLVNDAGISGGSRRLHELDIDAWDRTISVNLRGTFLCARAAIPHLVRRPRSAMINIASTYGLIGAPLAPSYCASKGGIVNLTRQLAVDYSRDGLRVNAICPGYIDTDMGGRRELSRRSSAPPPRRAAKRMPPCSPSAARGRRRKWPASRRSLHLTRRHS
jgi:NAD(P)-dependent dehydrogenase (short-subunit alcohol dehydrogenase family)